MTLGAKVTVLGWGVLVVWDLISPPGHTISEAFARGLADRRTRIPVALAIIANVAHVIVLARQMRKEERA